MTLLIYGTTLTALLAALALSEKLHRPFWLFSRDLVSIANVPAYTGALSNFTALLWAASAAIALYSASLLKERDGKWALFLLAVGAGLGYVCVDDMFLLHERLVPELIGLSEKKIYAVYLVVALMTAMTFRAQVLQLEVAKIAAPVLFLSAAIASDLFLRPAVHWAEDGFKTLGAAAVLDLIVSVGKARLRTDKPDA